MEPATELLACAVRVPCSTSNLGSGFDCLGLAFQRYLEAGYVPGPDALQLRRSGTLESLTDAAADDVLVRAFRAELRRRHVEDVTGTIVMTSMIPIGRGLGSSAAAAVAGIVLATAASGGRLDRGVALGHAASQEGHPDNAAPTLYGGLVAVVYAAHEPRALKLPLSDRLGFVFAAPEAEVSTQRARAALPQHVAHSAAARNQGRMAALLYGLANADGDAIRAGLVDELHVPYRLPLIPGGSDALQAAAAAGAWGATISGSGSGLIALCESGLEGAVLDAMVHALRRATGGGDGFIARTDHAGAQPRDLRTLLQSMSLP